MRRWIGRWIIGVSTIHTIFALAVFPDVWLGILSSGVINTVGNDPVIGAPVWFLFWGLLLYVIGFVIDAIEKRNISPLPISLGWGLLFITIIGVVLMPISGIWLLFPPSLAVIIRNYRGMKVIT